VIDLALIACLLCWTVILQVKARYDGSILLYVIHYRLMLAFLKMIAYITHTQRLNCSGNYW